MKVYVVESGAYEQRGIDLIAASPEAAVRALKETYKSPYVVEWGELTLDGREWWIVGKFDAVAGYSTFHSSTFSITEYEVE